MVTQFVTPPFPAQLHQQKNPKQQSISENPAKAAMQEFLCSNHLRRHDVSPGSSRTPGNDQAWRGDRSRKRSKGFQPGVRTVGAGGAGSKPAAAPGRAARQPSMG